MGILIREKQVRVLCRRLEGSKYERAARMAIEGFAIVSYRSCEDLDGHTLDAAIAEHEDNLIKLLCLMANDIKKSAASN